MKRVARNLFKRQAPGGGGIWIFRYQLDGREHQMSLGPLDLIPLAKAKERALENRLKVHKGINPLSERRAQKPAGVHSFDAVATEYIETRAASWKPGSGSAAQWLSSLKSYASPVLGRMPVNRITTHDVARALKPRWLTRHNTSLRVRRRIEKVMAYAVHKEYRPRGPNPADLEAITFILGEVKTATTHFAALHYQDIPALVADLKSRDDMTAKALLLCLSTATRTTEIRNALWSEIDGDVWRIPVSRLKSGKRPHAVPLCKEALAILEGLPRSGPLIFPGLKRDDMLELLQELRGKGPTVHGTARAGFKSWASEATDFPRELIEICLAHTLGPLDASYQRGELLAKRRALLRSWAAFLFGVKPERVLDVRELRFGRR